MTHASVAVDHTPAMGARRLALPLLAALALAAALPAAALATGGGAAPGGSTPPAAGGAAPGRAPAGREKAIRARPSGGARVGVKPRPDPRIRRRALARKRALARRRALLRRRAVARRRIRRLAARRLAARRRTHRRHPAPVLDLTGPTAPTRAGRFPVAGPHTILGGGGRFGADRGDHIHQGQDIPAAEGTPVVAPVRGTVIWRSYQRGGAGYYLVLHAADARDYVFMHLRKGSIEVVVGDRVGAGRRLAEVGQTGHAEGPHLHFEVWVGGWRAEGGRAIDPLPSLKAWGG